MSAYLASAVLLTATIAYLGIQSRNMKNSLEEEVKVLSNKTALTRGKISEMHLIEVAEEAKLRDVINKEKVAADSASKTIADMKNVEKEKGQLTGTQSQIDGEISKLKAEGDQMKAKILELTGQRQEAEKTEQQLNSEKQKVQQEIAAVQKS